jgi:hypothetical protein
MFGALGFYSAKGMTVVPGVTGQSQATAETNLTNANLTYTTTTLNTNVEIQGGTVGSQSVSPGELVDYGTQIVLGVYSYTALPQITNPTLSQSRNGSTTATVSVTNYDSSVSYTISSSGTATFSAGIFSITGIGSTTSFSATVYANKSGFSEGQGSINVSSWSDAGSVGGNISTVSTTSSSVTVSISTWNTTTSSVAYYVSAGPTTVYSSATSPATSQSNPQVTNQTISGLSSGTTFTFNLYILGNLVSTTSATTGTTPPPVSQTWYCRRYNEMGGVIASFTSSTDQTSYANCDAVTYCRLDGYPTTAVFC